jgi:hypothetical protein
VAEIIENLPRVNLLAAMMGIVVALVLLGSLIASFAADTYTIIVLLVPLGLFVYLMNRFGSGKSGIVSIILFVGFSSVLFGLIQLIFFGNEHSILIAGVALVAAGALLGIIWRVRLR